METMTIKEIAELTGLTKQTIINHVKTKYPNLVEHGKTTKLSKEQVMDVVGELKIEVSKDLTVQTNNLPVKNDQFDMIKLFSDMQKQNQEFMKMIVNEIREIKSSSVKQLEYSQDYFSIIGYANYKDIKLLFSDAVKLGKEAKKLSNEKDIEVRSIPDERWGKVNSYNITVLEKIFEI